MICGPVAHLVEHLLCKQGVTGSSPVGSTVKKIIAGFILGIKKLPYGGFLNGFFVFMVHWHSTPFKI